MFVVVLLFIPGTI